MARVLKRSGRPVRVVVNKVDSDQREADVWDALSLGLGDPWPVSALHGRGTGDLLDDVVAAPARGRGPVRRRRRRPAATPGTDGLVDLVGASVDAGGPTIPRVALVGPAQRRQVDAVQPAGGRRALGHPRRTRAPPATPWTPSSRPPRARSASSTPPACAASRGPSGGPSTSRCCGPSTPSTGPTSPSWSSTPPPASPTRTSAWPSASGASGCPVVVVLNKWELVPTEDRVGILADVGDRLAFLGEAPVLKISALSGLGVHHILPAVAAAEEAYHSRIPTGELNRALKSIQVAHPPVGRPDPVRRPGGQRPAHLHPVHQRPAPAHLPPLRRAGPARAVRPRPDPDQDPGPGQGRQRGWGAQAVTPGRPDRGRRALV